MKLMALKIVKKLENKTGKKKTRFGHKGPLLDPKAGKLIAITGGIGTGKTFVLECFAKFGFAVFNADKAIHEMLEIGGAAYEEVAKLFPDAVTQEGIDRKIISDIVFADVEKLKQLETILHPKLRQAQLDLVIEVKKGHGSSVIFEVPLLFENKREGHYDFVILITAPKAIQKERVLQRKNMTQEKFDAIIGQQVSDKVRLRGAHFVINTGKNKEDTLRQIRKIVKNDGIKRNSAGYRDHRPIRKKR
jgi:dephospho-CoA kinase